MAICLIVFRTELNRFPHRQVACKFSRDIKVHSYLFTCLPAGVDAARAFPAIVPPALLGRISTSLPAAWCKTVEHLASTGVYHVVALYVNAHT